MDGTKKTKAQLIAELEAMRHRLETLEKRPGKERRNNYLLRIFIDALPNFGFAFDGHGRVLQVLTGNRTSESRVLEGRLLADILPQEDAEELGNALRKTFDTGEAQHFEFIISVLAGRRWFQIRTSLVRDQDGGEEFVVFLFQDITNEKLTESVLEYAQLELRENVAALRESEENYRHMFEFANDSIFIVDTKTLRFLDVNENAANRLGYSREELLQKTVDEINEPGSVPRIKKDIGQLLKTDGSVFERTHYRKDGTEVPVEVSGRIIEYNGQKALISFVRDITERKRAEEALRESEEKYRMLVDGSIEGILVHRDFKVLHANQAAANILGYKSVDDLEGVDLLETVALPENRSKTIAQYDACLKGKGNQTPLYVPGLRKDGKIIWMEQVFTLVNWEGKPAVQVTGNDITERKRAEEALRESEERLRTITDSVPGFISYVDKNYRYQFNNKKYSEWFGLPIEEFKGKHMREIIGDAAFEVSLHAIEKVMAGEEIIFENEIPNKEGGFSYVRAYCVPHFGENNEVLGFYSLVTDITEHKQLEAQLLVAQKMEAIGTLAGGIAHNFNNLLQMIMGNVSLLLMETDSSHPQHEILSAIKDRVKSGAELAKQLLGFARGGKYQVKPTDLNKILAVVSRMFARTHKKITIRRKYQRNLSATDVDQGQIEQVLLNLFVNAQQAMPRGGKIIVQSKNVTLDDDFVKPHDLTPGRYVKLSVTDTGTGMDQEILGRIFEPFFTTKKIGQGSGLGLASVYGIIKNHGGIITVNSEVRKGTTFDIYLPATDEEIVEIKESPKAEERKGTGTILVVDDEEGIVDAVRRTLEIALGYDVFTAKSGAEAIKVYSKNGSEIGLVILDLIMPKMGGGETFDKLRELNPKVKVLLSSGYSLEGEAAEIMERGCDGFIQKPFDPEELSKQINAVLKQN